jgi:hypothetical protein
MLLGCVYIPPENSKYSSEEAFIEAEDELLFFSRYHKNILDKVFLENDNYPA